MAALTGVGVGGAIGGISGALIGMGIPEYEAKRYEGRVKEGGLLLSVHSDNSDWTRKAKDILDRTGADDASSTGEKKGDFANAAKQGDEQADPVLRIKAPLFPWGFFCLGRCQNRKAFQGSANIYLRRLLIPPVPDAVMCGLDAVILIA